MAQGSVALRSQITSEPDSSAPRTPTRHTLINGVLTRILAQTGLANTHANGTKVTLVLQAMDIKLSEQLSTLRYTLAQHANTQRDARKYLQINVTHSLAHTHTHTGAFLRVSNEAPVVTAWRRLRLRRDNYAAPSQLSLADVGEGCERRRARNNERGGAEVGFGTDPAIRH